MQNVSLKHLTLIECGIGEYAMIEIAKGIREAICLEYVDLRHNHFEKEGFVALIDALKATMACKVLQLEGLAIGIEEAELLASFFNHADCQLYEVDLHQAELQYDVMERLATSLKTCAALKAISFSKNNLGIDDFDETDSEFEDAAAFDQEKDTNRNKAMCPLD